MKTEIKNGSLIIFLEGRIDTNNAAHVEEEIRAAIDGMQGETDVSIDAEELSYISSAGLRVLMKVRKKINKPLKVFNVSRDVYDIFETTGFTDLFEVKKALRKIDIDGCQMIGEGVSGKVYRLDEETIVKVFYPGVDFDTLIAQENEKARNAFVAGIPTAIPYDIVRVGDDQYGTVYELLNAEDLVSVILKDREHTDDYIRKFARLVKEIHGIHVDTEKLGSVKAASIAGLPMLASVFNEEEMKKIRRIYENIPDRDTFIHGDCHIGNVMIQDGEFMFIDLATAGSGHPIFDFGTMLSFADRASDPEAMAKSPILRNFAPEEIRNIWNVFIHEYFGTDDEALIKKAEEQIRIVQLVRSLFAVVVMPGLFSPEQIAGIKSAALAYCDKGIEPICF